jgi:hypothetical protein
MFGDIGCFLLLREQVLDKRGTRTSAGMLGTAIVVVRAVTLRGWCHQSNFGDAFSATMFQTPEPR